MDIDAACTEIETQLKTISGLRVRDASAATPPPFAILDFPVSITFDETYGRGADTMALKLAVAVGRPNERTTRKRLAQYCDGSGASSIKSVVEAGAYTTFHSIHVAGVSFASWQENGVEYAAAVFDIEVVGEGA